MMDEGDREPAMQRYNILNDQDYDLEDAQKDGIKSIFDVLDREGSGTVKGEAVRAVLQRLEYKGDVHNDLDMIMEDNGVDGDADISLHQLLDLTRYIFWRDEVTCQLGKAFQVFDIDGDGYIDGSDLARVMSRINIPLTPIELRRMMKQADRDRDGKLNFEEFKIIMLK